MWQCRKPHGTISRGGYGVGDIQRSPGRGGRAGTSDGTQTRPNARKCASGRSSHPPRIPTAAPDERPPNLRANPHARVSAGRSRSRTAGLGPHREKSKHIMVRGCLGLPLRYPLHPYTSRHLEETYNQSGTLESTTNTLFTVHTQV